MEPAVEFTREELKEILGQWLSGRELDRLPDIILIPYKENRLTQVTKWPPKYPGTT